MDREEKGMQRSTEAGTPAGREEREAERAVKDIRKKAQKV